MIVRQPLLILLLLLSGLSPSLGWTSTLAANALQTSAASHEALQARSFPAPPVRARSAFVMDASNGRALLAVNAHLHLPMASTTKIMTGLMAVELGKLSDRITVPASAFNFESDATVMGLHAGQVVSLKDLLYGLLLPSGADAANTIAIHYAGSEAHFVKLMNQEAALLGMGDTHYVDATGLSSQGHFSSAYDLAVIGQYVSYLPALLKVTSTRSYKWDGRVLRNINKVLYWYPGVDGVKPGFTDAAGICQVLDARRGGRHVAAAILNTPNLDTDARNLLNFGLRDFTWVRSALPADNPSVQQMGTDRWGPYAYFAASGHYLHGRFIDAYKRNGGFDVLGLPRTEQLSEGSKAVQYFENGALQIDNRSGKLSRLALGPRIVGLNVPAAPQASATPTAATAPSPTATSVRISIAPSLRSFTKTHAWLGVPVSPATKTSGILVQVFKYGGLAGSSGHVSLLPIGDRLLSALRYLPSHPGTAYPSGFASTAVLKSIGWM